MGNCGTELFQFMGMCWRMVLETFNRLEIYSILGDPMSSDATKIACGIFPQFCQFAEGYLITKDPTLDNAERFQVYMGHFPSAASIQSLIHYAQMIKRDDIRLYDWGSNEKNMEKYGQDTPPLVDLTAITDVPVAMFVGLEDDLGDPSDAQWARD
jgi:hypothetical protein